MFPLRDINPSKSVPRVTYLLVAINAAVWLLQFGALMGSGDAAFTEMVMEWGMIPQQVTGLFFHGVGESGTAATPFTHMFMHGGWMHFVGNMWFLWVFGDNVEDLLGHRRFALFYVLCGLVAAASQMIIDPASPVPMVGASGAIAGVLSGYVLFHPMARVVTFVPLFFVIEVPAFLFIFVWFGMQLLNGTVSLAADTGGGGVAFFAHIGGFVAGAVLAPLFRKLGRQPTPRQRARRFHASERVDER